MSRQTEEEGEEDIWSCETATPYFTPTHPRTNPNCYYRYSRAAPDHHTCALTPTLVTVCTFFLLPTESQNMTGTLPTVTLEFPSLQRLHLYDNSFTGTIPDAFFNTPNLVDLHLRSNFLSGTIPKSLFDIENNRNDALFNLNLGHNLLTGTIPTEIGVLTSLQGLFLDNNHFTGTIPTEIGQLEVLCESQIGRGKEGGRRGSVVCIVMPFTVVYKSLVPFKALCGSLLLTAYENLFLSSTSLRICTRLYLTVSLSLSPSVHTYACMYRDTCIHPNINSIHPNQSQSIERHYPDRDRADVVAGVVL